MPPHFEPACNPDIRGRSAGPGAEQLQNFVETASFMTLWKQTRLFGPWNGHLTNDGTTSDKHNDTDPKDVYLQTCSRTVYWQKHGGENFGWQSECTHPHTQILIPQPGTATGGVRVRRGQCWGQYFPHVNFPHLVPAPS